MYKYDIDERVEHNEISEVSQNEDIEIDKDIDQTVLNFNDNVEEINFQQNIDDFYEVEIHNLDSILADENMETNVDFDEENRDISGIYNELYDLSFDERYNDFFEKYNYQEEEKIYAIDKNTVIQKHNLRDDIQATIEYYRQDDNIEKYTAEQLDYLKNDDMGKILENYGISRDELYNDYLKYSKNIDVYNNNYNHLNFGDNFEYTEKIKEDSSNSDDVSINENILSYELKKYDFSESYEIIMENDNADIFMQNNNLDTIEINSVNFESDEDRIKDNLIDNNTNNESYDEINIFTNDSNFEKEIYNDSLDKINISLENFESDKKLQEKENIMVNSNDLDMNFEEENNANKNLEFNDFNDEQVTLNDNLSKIVDERLRCSDESCQKLYEFYQGEIKIGDKNYLNTPHYDIINKEINFNEVVDLNNILGAGTTYLHEVGHLLDDWGGNGHTYLSDDEEFGNNLRNDFEKYISNTMIKNDCTYNEALKIVSEDLKQTGAESISDLYGGLSNNQCIGYWTHSTEYWNKKYILEKEAFAHFFENSCNSPVKIKNAKKFFPTAYERFLLIVKEGVY